MKQKKVILIAFIIIIIGLLVVLFATGVFKIFFKAISNSDEYVMTKYKSERYGYSVKYPTTWKMDDSQKETPADLILNPSKDAAVLIQLINDPTLSNEGSFDLVSNEAKKQLDNNPKYKVELFKLVPEHSSPSSPSLVTGGFVAAGTFLGAETNQEWRFKEYGIFTKTGKAFYVRGNIKKEVAEKYGEIVNQIMDSFNIE